MKTKIVLRSLLLSSAFVTVVAHAQSLREANMLSENEQYTRAAIAFRTLLTTDASSGETWFAYGENFFQQERSDSAKYCYDRGVEVNPRHPLCHVGQGKMLWVSGDKSIAQQKFQAAVAAAMDKANKFPKELQARTHREIAQALGTGPSKGLTQALASVDKGLAIDPNDPEAYIVKGDLQFEENPTDASRALVNYKRAIELAPMSARPLAKKALMYHRGANAEAAIAEYSRAIERDPSYAPSYAGRAESYFMAKNYALATADYDKYLSLNSGNRSARIRYAKFLFLTKNYTGAIKEIEALRNTGASDPSLKRIEGYAYTEAGDLDKAKLAMDAYFIEQDPARIIATDHEYMGKIYTGLSERAGDTLAPVNYDSLATEMFMKGAQMDRSMSQLYIEAMKGYLKSKQYDKAVNAVRMKLASGKIEVNDYYYLGNAANKGKMWATADSAWTTYITKQPSLFQGYMGRARANVGMDPEKKTWQARPFYEDVIRNMKPEEETKYRNDAEEAYFYLGFYHFYSTKDLAAAKCWFEKVKALNVGTPNTKVANDMLLSKELAGVTVGACELVP